MVRMVKTAFRSTTKVLHPAYLCWFDYSTKKWSGMVGRKRQDGYM